MKRILIAALLATALGGCAQQQQYHIEGTAYPNAQAFLSATRANHTNGLAAVTTLPQPVTNKTLVFAIPSERAVYQATLEDTQRTANGLPINMDAVQTMAAATYNSISHFGKATQKRNIYRSVTFVDMDSMSASVTASDQADALYLTRPQGGDVQWFFASAKGGKQIFAYDRSQPGVAGKLSSFADAVQVLAIRE